MPYDSEEAVIFPWTDELTEEVDGAIDGGTFEMRGCDVNAKSVTGSRSCDGPKWKCVRVL